MISQNRGLRHDYELLDAYEAGIVLTGPEVKSVKTRGINLDNAYVKVTAGEPRLINAVIQPYQFADNDDYDSTRSRKLLLNKKEILKIQNKLSQGSNLTVVPVKCYNKRGLIKLEIALAKGRKTWERKRVEKDIAEKRRDQKEFKEFIKK